ANKRGTEVAATLQVLDGTDVMLVTDAGRLIRVPVDQVRVMSRQASGVTLFRLNENERVTSVFPVMDDEEEGDTDAAVGAAPAPAAGEAPQAGPAEDGSAPSGDDA
ncbi:MAG: DNA gyrase C-terminal beta-propeller domain-containing protein, partial [Acetobacter malorum]